MVLVLNFSERFGGTGSNGSTEAGPRTGAGLGSRAGTRSGAKTGTSTISGTCIVLALLKLLSFNGETYYYITKCVLLGLQLVVLNTEISSLMPFNPVSFEYCIEV